LQLLDYLETFITEGGYVVEYHSSEFFPERWFQAVYVVRCNTNILFQRLEQRGYNSKKISNNVEYEIFQMALDEAKSSYSKDIVHEVWGETEEQLEENLKKVEEFVNNYDSDN
jgi:adenylate kinase